jgi:signal transduction histidine kinase
MKLLNKTSIYYLVFALPVFAICSGLMYYLVSSEIIDNLDESLWKEKTDVEHRLKNGVNPMYLQDDHIALKSIVQNVNDSDYFFSDTMMYDKMEEEILPFRVLRAPVSDGKNNYTVTIQESYIESDDLISSILTPVIILFIVLLLGFFLINWFISKKLWGSFYKTLEQLQHFKIDNTPVKFEAARIREFSELNAVLTVMTEKIYTDYISQKQFIENASHEIQTPLAVIKSKIELLIQSSTLSENDMLIIQSVYNASNKLSALNRALLLLSKIENQQFKDADEIKFKISIERTLENFEDIIALKNIRIKKDYSSEPVYKMNPILADILVGNLLQNAIRHNIPGGSIDIHLSDRSLLISNTSASSVINTDELFQRFKKNEASAESIGLGLAIVKEICDTNNIRINYVCDNSVHTVELKFQ